MKSNNTDTQVTSAPPQRVAGQLLAQQREQLGLDIEECAEALKISVYKVKALESGDDKPFTSEIFIRGYLKNYAKLVNLSEEEILHSYDIQKEDDQVKVEAEVQSGQLKKSKWWLPYVAGIIIVAGWFIISSIPSSDDSSAESVSSSLVERMQSLQEQLLGSDSGGVDSLSDNVISEESSAEPEQTLQEYVAQKQQAALDTQSDSLLGDPSANESDGNVPNDEVIDSEIINSVNDPLDNPLSDNLNADVESLFSASQASLNEESDFSELDSSTSTLDQLYFTFLEVCWVEVVDASNQVIFSDLQRANTELTLEGVAPFSIILGNINGTVLRLNNEPVALLNSEDGRTLRLSVGS